MTSRDTFVCPADRVASRSGFLSDGSCVCTVCGKPMKNMGKRWRPPRKSNNKAWTKIARGDYWWDDRALAKADHSQEHLTVPNPRDRTRAQAAFRAHVPKFVSLYKGRWRKHPHDRV